MKPLTVDKITKALDAAAARPGVTSTEHDLDAAKGATSATIASPLVTPPVRRTRASLEAGAGGTSVPRRLAFSPPTEPSRTVDTTRLQAVARGWLARRALRLLRAASRPGVPAQWLQAAGGRGASAAADAGAGPVGRRDSAELVPL